MPKRTRTARRRHTKPIPLPPLPAYPPILFANWKMNLTPDASSRAARRIVRDAGDLGIDATLVVCPAFPALPQVHRLLDGTQIALGAQDVYWEDSGSFTGEVSALDLQDLGVRYVIIGHSERRTYLGETDDMVNRKMLAAVRHGLTPVVCVGETMDERRTGRQDMLITRQVQAACRNVRPPFRGQQFIIAYEPLWAIGSGEACAPAEAARMAEIIQYALLELYDERIVRDTIRIIYGGSVTALNIRSYVSAASLSGALVGGASLDPASYLAMAAAISPRSVAPAAARKRRPHAKRRHHKRH